jgi:hypothetical protein
MALPQEVRSSYQALVNSGNIRYVVYPVGAPTAVVSDGSAAAWAWAAYVQIVAAGVIADPCWLCGAIIHTAAVETHNGDIAIASGAAGSETDLAIFGYAAALAGATANTAAMPILSKLIRLPFPIRIAGSPRLAARLRKSTAASAAGVSMKVLAATAVGT